MNTTEREIERMEAEAGCNLPELANPSLADRARRLLGCDDPPRGDDAEALRRILTTGLDRAPDPC